jgi:hypothetical protein
MKVTCKLNPQNACYCSVRRLLTKDRNVNFYKTKVLCYCVHVWNFVPLIKGTSKMRALQDMALKRIFVNKGQEFPGGWGNYIMLSFGICTFIKRFSQRQNQEK